MKLPPQRHLCVPNQKLSAVLNDDASRPRLTRERAKIVQAFLCRKQTIAAAATRNHRSRGTQMPVGVGPPPASVTSWLPGKPIS
jgi:hypothetical protein